MSKNIKRIVSFLVISTLFLSGLKVFEYLDTDDTKSFTRIMMHQLYESNQNIDVLFVGSSHVYRSLIPDIADVIFDEYTFNAGSSSQCLDGSYAVIKEALENNDVSHVYLEMYYDIAIADAYEERTEMTGTYIIADYIKNPVNRITYLLNASSKEYYVNSFLIARRNWGGLSDINKIITTVKGKNSESYKNYEYVRAEDDTEYYVDRGYVASELVLDKDNIYFSKAFGEINIDNISDDYLNSLDDIVNLCEEKNIELTLFIAPEPESTIIGKGNYDEYSSYQKALADSYNIEFYDFNYCKAEYFDTNDSNMFMDEDHLSTAGAEKFTEVFALFFSGEISYEDLFYESLTDKIEDEEEKIFGIAGLEETDNGYKCGYIISNRQKGIEYKISISEYSGDIYVLQNFSEDKYFEIPAETSGTIKIEARLTGSNEVFQVLEGTI